VRCCSPEAGAAVDAEVVVFRVVAEAFLTVEVVFREEVAISLEAAAVFPAVVAVFLAVALSSGAAVFLAAAEVISSEGPIVFPVAVVAAFPGAAIVFPAGAVAVPLEGMVLPTIPHCSPTSADRDRVAVECRRIQPEANQAATVDRWEEAPHNYLPAIARVAIWEVGPRNFAIKTEPERVEAT